MKRAFLAIIMTAGIAAPPQPTPEAMVAAGHGHSIVLGPGGAILTWGANEDGQLGDGTRLQRSMPSPLNGLAGFAAVSAGGAHMLALKNGAVWSWGSNRYGQLGVSGIETSLIPAPLDLTEIVAISAGEGHSLAIRKDGGVWSWGDNRWGQLGLRSNPTQFTPALIVGVRDLKAVSAGGRHSLALANDGSVWGWGNNSESQVGDLTGIERVAPARIPGAPQAAAVASGGRHSLALALDGRVWTWGSNQYGQLGDAWGGARATPTSIPDFANVRAISAGARHSLALKQDGSVWAWGDNRAGQIGDSSRAESTVPIRVSGLPEIVAIAAGESHSLAIGKDGSIWTWGGGAEGKQDTAEPRRVRPQAESAGEAPDANVATPTFNPDGTTPIVPANPPNNPPDHLRVTINCSTSGATIYYTVDGSDPAQGPPQNGTQIAPGGFVDLPNSLTLKAKAYKAGLNPSAIKSNAFTLQVATPAFSPAAGPYPSAQTITLTDATPGAEIRYTTDGTDPVSTSTLYTVPFLVRSTTTLKAKGFRTGWAASGLAPATYTINIGSVAAGLKHSVAMKPDGTVWTWGSNSDKQLGDPSVASRTLPAQVTAMPTVKAIAAGGYHTVVLKSDNTVWAWGRNAEGQLGNKSNTQSSSPVQAWQLTNVAAIAAGGKHTVALTTSGTVYTWGNNASGQLGDNTLIAKNQPILVSGVTGVVGIAAGADHTLVLKSDATIWGWGSNLSSQLGTAAASPQKVPVQLAGLTSGSRIAGGNAHTMTVRSPLGFVGWGLGANGSGQLGTGNFTSSEATPVQVINLTGLVAVSAGTSHSLGLKSDDMVSAWGLNDFGQLGNGTTVTTATPGGVTGLTNIAQVSAGAKHNLALTYDGIIWSWGDNTDGALGDGTTIGRSSPVRVTETNFAWKLATPVLAPATGTSSGSISVMLTDASAGVRIYYTTDGTEPSQAPPTSPSVTSGSFVGVLNSPLKAKAFPFPPNGSQPPSNTAVGTYTFFVADCMFTPGAGGPPLTASPSPIQVFNQTALNVSGVVIHYTTNGADPTENDPTIANFGNVQLDMPVNGTKTLKARAWRPNTSWTPSGITAVTYTMKVGAPTFTPGGGTYSAAQNVQISTVTSGATIHYTTTGVEPTESDPTIASGATFNVSQAMTLKARAWKAGWVTSDPTPATYWVTAGTVATPTISPTAGTYTSPQTVTLATTTPGATIRYTLDGTNPSWTSPIYSSPFSIAANVTVKAKAFKPSWTPSGIASAAYVIDLGTVAVPLVSPGSGSYTTKRTVTVTCATPNVTIRYTRDGTDPTTSTPDTVASGSTLQVDYSQMLKVKAWDNSLLLPPSGVRRGDYFITGAIAAGEGHTMALKPDGTVWTWGLNSYGQLGINSTTNSSIPVQVLDPPDPTGKLTDVVAIAAGDGHSLAVKSDGTVRSWGRNFTGQLGNGSTSNSLLPVTVQGLPSSPPDVIGVAAADAVGTNTSFSLALRANGTVFAWGHNGWGQVGDGSGVSPRTTAFAVSGLTGVTSIAAGAESGYALKTDGAPAGTVWAWGRNFTGSLGDGTTTTRTVPVSGLPQVTQIGAGGGYGLAVKADVTTWGWGDDQSGQLGDGASGAQLYRLTPVLVGAGLTGLRAVAGGQSHSLGARTDGSIWGWGRNSEWQLDSSGVQKLFPGALNAWADVAAVAAGSTHSVALKVDGTIWTWGNNAWGQIGNNTSNNFQTTPFQVPGFGVGAGSWMDADPDGDGLSNWQELILGTDPMNPDTNGDGISDGASVQAGISPTNTDHDGDGLANATELQMGTDPFMADTDGDGVNDLPDCFPLDPTRSTCPPPDPNDHTPPAITLTEPTNAVLISSVP